MNSKILRVTRAGIRAGNAIAAAIVTLACSIHRWALNQAILAADKREAKAHRRFTDANVLVDHAQKIRNDAREAARTIRAECRNLRTGARAELASL